jgi:hypothetical protein
MVMRNETYEERCLVSVYLAAGARARGQIETEIEGGEKWYGGEWLKERSIMDKLSSRCMLLQDQDGTGCRAIL